MPQFSLKRLFVSVTLIAVGCGFLMFGRQINYERDPPGWINWLLSIAFTASLGAGIGNVYRQPILGALLGPPALLVLYIVVLGLL
jgi:hypothetical protein